MRFLFALSILSSLLPQHFLAASLNGSKASERTTNEGCVFNNIYNSGLSTLQAQEILKRVKTVEQKLEEIKLKGPSKASCPPRWKVFNGSCFFAFIKPKATWNEARYVCQSLGGDLAKITSAAENNFTYGLISGDLSSLNYVWIGLKKGGDGNFYWVDGSSLTLPFWDKSEPDGSGNCGIFYRGASVPNKWHDSARSGCDSKGGYVCKMATMK